MLPSERRAIILEEVSRQSAVSIRALTTLLGVSRETVRKDIELLAQQRTLQQVRGGATKIISQEPPIESRSITNIAGKKRIARYIARHIPNGASLMIDCGSTTFEVANQLVKSHKDLIVYTNDLRIAQFIAPATRELTLIGGRVVVSELATHGLETIENLSRYRAEFGLIGVGGVSERALLTDFTREAASLRHQMMLQTETPFLLADSSKFGVVGRVAMKPIPDRTILVTDDELSTDILLALKPMRVAIRVAD